MKQQILIKDAQALAKMQVAGQRLSTIMQNIGLAVVAGATTADLDRLIDERMTQENLVAVCKKVPGYKHATCISVNDVIVHGIPSEHIVLKNGDFVKIDVVASFEGYCADMARYFFVGQPLDSAVRLATAAQQALDLALSMVKPGVLLSDISHAIQSCVEAYGYGVVRDFAGHGIGRQLHEAPEVPNYGPPGHGPVLCAGMVLAIEPMITERDYRIKIDKDGWTARTRDGGLAAHVEDTVAVLPEGALVMTRTIG